ncbi:C-4 methylsterol oxidase [Aureococcus anophagefferens]|uniref:C-4 methylsterol oxidase n=1 Tax=Aureococcus anophagefferens TaxID=44056 RepID=A0ABR1G0G8_AURAN
MSALLSAGPGAPATPPSHAPLPAPSSASSLATLGSRSAFDVLSDGPLEHVLTFLDCKALCVSKVAMRDFLTVTAHPRFVARLKRLRGFDDAPMAPMVDARERSFHLDTAALATTVERVAVFEELRALERNHVAFHLATLTPTRRSARLVAKRQEALAWSYDVGLAHFWPPSQEFARAEIYASFPQAGPAFAPSLPRYYDNMRPAARLSSDILREILSQDDDTDELPESDDDDDEDEDDSVGGGHVYASDSDGDDTGGSSEEEEDDDGEAPAYEPLLEEAA